MALLDHRIKICEEDTEPFFNSTVYFLDPSSLDPTHNEFKLHLLNPVAFACFSIFDYVHIRSL